MIYLDNAATTKMWPEAVDAMLPYFMQDYGNPSAMYDFAGRSKSAIRIAKKIIGDALGADAECIYFTSGGSESDNWAIKSVASSYAGKGKHIITSKIEHHAVLNTCKYLERHGYEVTYLDVDSDGMISLDALKRSIRPDTILISVMMANNEIGTIEPIAQIGEIAKANGIIFHTDAVQAVGHLPVDVRKMHIDMMSASAHKFGGPKGVGFLYIDKRLKLEPIIHGGSQERGLRAGTQNVPAIVGMGKALEISVANMACDNQKMKELRDYLMSSLMSRVPFSRINGSVDARLSSNVNMSFKYIDAQTLVVMLDTCGICVSTGAACNAAINAQSHVLGAIGLSNDEIKGSLRMTLGSDITKEDVDYVINTICNKIEQIRVDNNIRLTT